MSLFTNKFYPNFVSGLQLWLDASDSSTLFTDSAGTTPASNDGDPIGCWKDKSGNAYHVIQTDGTNKPTLRTASLNGRNVLDFDSNDFLQSLTGGSDVNFTLFFVNIKRGGQNTAMMPFGTGIADLGKARNFYHEYNKISYDTYGNAPYKFISEFDWTTNEANIGQVKFNINASTVALAKDNSSWTSDTAITTVVHNASTIYIGRSPGGYYWNGDICEIIYYTSIISDSARSSILSYLNNKWGVY